MWEQAVEWDGKGEILQARLPLPPSIPILHPPPRAQPSSVGLGEAGQAGQGASAPSTSLGEELVLLKPSGRWEFTAEPGTSSATLVMHRDKLGAAQPAERGRL